MTSKEKYGKEPRKMDQAIANKFLQDLKFVYDKIGLKFFLMYGTLIGAIRDNDFPWHDEDVDVGVFFEDFKQEIFDMANELFKEMGYLICTGPKINKRYTQIHIVNRQYPKYKVDTYMFCLYKGGRCNYRFTRSGEDYYLDYPLKYFKNFKEIDFLGAKYLVPNPPEELLDYMWGQGSWKIPAGGNGGINPFKRVPIGTFIPEAF